MSRPTQEPHPIVKHPNLPNTGSFAYSEVFFIQQNGKMLSFSLYHTTTGPLAANYNANTFAGALKSAIGTQFEAVIPTTSIFVGIRSHCHQGGIVYSGYAAANTAGSAAAPPLPDQVAVVVQKQTAMAGPYGRGRFFFRNVPSSFVSGEYLTSAAATAYQNLTVALLGSLSDTESNTWALAHYVRKVIPPATLGQFVTVQNLVVNTALFSARKSRPRRL